MTSCGPNSPAEHLRSQIALQDQFRPQRVVIDSAHGLFAPPYISPGDPGGCAEEAAEMVHYRHGKIRGKPHRSEPAHGFNGVFPICASAFFRWTKAPLLAPG